ncbi:MAG TPA: polyprenyl synthetase family protein [Bacteroidales bacterium]|nr:polyprenyl synthetase family protein [Bacteroidales bacterium]HQH18964.1 polyprenyl synthetase family protein [Bacteroidales bacterium]
MKTSVALLNLITRYITSRKGKQIRPMFVFFSAQLCGGITEKTYRAATLIELLHTATLVHDDIVDDSNKRRGFFSVNSLWKNKIAVLVGDFLLSRGMLSALENDDFALLKLVSGSVKEMSEGELLQLEKARNLDIDEDIYFEIIRKKTATLIASCCACGALSTEANEETIHKMGQFGEAVGIAFQLKDDLFDYEMYNKTGKPSGIDLKEQKMTLPLIHMLNNMSFIEKRKVIYTIKNHHENNEKVAAVIEMVNKSQSIEYAKQKMNDYLQKALNILFEFPESNSRNSLESLVKFVIERKN